MKLVVATFNIHHGRGRDGRLDLARTARAITACDADVVALQEVDRNVDRSGEVDQPAELARLTGLDLVFHPLFRYGGGTFGQALGSSTELDQRLELFPRLSSERRHGAIVASGQGVTIVATHLSAPEGPRIAQLEALVRLVAGLEGPVVVLGDLNAPTANLGPLLDLGFEGSGYHTTFPGRWFRRHIDHVLAGPGVRIAATSTIATTASDHLPVRAVVEFG